MHNKIPKRWQCYLSVYLQHSMATSGPKQLPHNQTEFSTTTPNKFSPKEGHYNKLFGAGIDAKTAKHVSGSHHCDLFRRFCQLLQQHNQWNWRFCSLTLCFFWTPKWTRILCIYDFYICYCLVHFGNLIVAITEIQSTSTFACSFMNWISSGSFSCDLATEVENSSFSSS